MQRIVKFLPVSKSFLQHLFCLVNKRFFDVIYLQHPSCNRNCHLANSNFGQVDCSMAAGSPGAVEAIASSPGTVDAIASFPGTVEAICFCQCEGKLLKKCSFEPLGEEWTETCQVQ